MISALFVILTPALMFLFYKRAIPLVREAGDDTTNLKSFNALFYELRTDGSKFILWFYYWFVFRRLIYVLNQLFLIDYPYFQNIFNIVHTFLNFLAIIVFKPYKDKLMNLIIGLYEFLTTIILLVLSFYLEETSKD